MIDYGPIVPNTHNDKQIFNPAINKPADVKVSAAHEEIAGKNVQPTRDTPKDSSFISEEAKKAFEEQAALRVKEEAERKRREEEEKKKKGKKENRFPSNRGIAAYERARDHEPLAHDGARPDA
jgi:hypothetical protein